MKLPALSLGGLAALILCAITLAVPGLLPAQTPSWTPAGPFGGSVSNFATHPTAPGVLYAAGPGGVFRTRNAGASWQWLPGPANLSVAAIDPTQPRTLYAASLFYPQTSVFKSTDEGARWRPVSRNLPATLNITSLVVDPARPARIYFTTANRGVWRSGDGGVTWQPVNQGLPTGPNTFTVLAVPRRPAGTAFAGTAAGLFRTRNAGGTWEALRGGLPTGRVAALAIAPSDPQTLYASIEDAGIFRSRDGGSSWVAAGDPIPPSSATPEGHSLAVHPRAPLTVYAARSGTGVFRTTDGGRSWSPTAPPLSSFISTLALDASAAVYAGLSLQGTDAGGVLRSANNGASWERRNQGLLGLQTLSVAADPTDPDNLVTPVLGLGLFRSVNAALRWVPVRSDIPPIQFAGFVTITEVVADGTGTFYFVDPFLDPSHGPRRIWKSSDAGRTWTPLSGPWDRLQIVRVDPLDPETLYVITYNDAGLQIYRSEDGGASWTPRPSLLPATCGSLDFEVARTSASAPATFYLGGCGSEDGGATWSQPNAGLPLTSAVTELAVDPQDPRIAYAGFQGGFSSLIRGIWKSTDSARSWRRITGPIANRSIRSLTASPEPGVLWASTYDSGIYRSLDFGETWQELSGGLPLEVSGFTFGPGRVYAATRNGVWVLEDD